MMKIKVQAGNIITICDTQMEASQEIQWLREYGFSGEEISSKIIYIDSKQTSVKRKENYD